MENAKKALRAWKTAKFTHGQIISEFGLTRCEEFAITCYGVTNPEHLKSIEGMTGEEMSIALKRLGYRHMG